METSERILRAAEREFARAGFTAARLADIARRAGIRRPSLLYHFPTKERLYEAVVERTFGRLGEVLAAAMAGPLRFEARLEAVVRAYEGFLAAQPDVARIIAREVVHGEGPGQAILAERVAPVVDAVEAFLRRAGARHLRPGVPVRAALFHVASDVVLRHAAGDLRDRLWGPRDPDATWRVAHALLLEPAPEAQ